MLRTIWIFIFMITLLNLSFAQILNHKMSMDKISITNKYSYSNKIKTSILQRIDKSSKMLTNGSRWYNYAATMNSNNGGLGSLNRAYLFPDTSVYTWDGMNYHKAWVHAAAVVLDPTDTVFHFSGSVDISKNDPYRLDSVGIYCKYVRHLPANVVDTLIVEFLAESNSNMPNYYFTNALVQNNYGVDTVFFKGLSQTNARLIDNNKIVVKFPLTAAVAADTLASGINYLMIGTPSPVFIPAGNIIAMTFQFKPAYTYSPSDTLNNMNYLEFFTYEENGDNTYPFYSKSFFNQSFIVSDYLGGNWSSLFTPSVAFVKAYQYENHLVDFKLAVGQSLPSTKLVISEIMYNDLSSSDSLEYFELFNPMNNSINLGGYTITKGVNFSFPPNTYLLGGQYMVIAKDSALVNSVFGISGTFQWDSGGLKNSGEVIMIQNAYGDTLAFVDYDDSSPWPVEGDGNGPSIEFCNPVPFYNNDGALWSASNNFISLFNGDSIFGTPGTGCVVSSIENYKEKDDNISMYPNPANDMLFFDNITSDFEVNIYDTKGILVKQFIINDGSQSISIEQLESGIYFIQFVNISTKNNTVKKLIVQ